MRRGQEEHVCLIEMEMCPATFARLQPGTVFVPHLTRLPRSDAYYWNVYIGLNVNPDGTIDVVSLKHYNRRSDKTTIEVKRCDGLVTQHCLIVKWRE